MARKPNYRFERFERERAKAAKKAERAKARAERRTGQKDEEPAAEDVAAADEAPTEPDGDKG